MAKFYTLTQAQTELNVSKNTMYRWIKNHKIVSEKVGGQYQIDKQTIDDFKHHYRNYAHPDAKSSKQVCQELNITLQQLYNLTNRYHIAHFNVLRQNYSYFEPHAVNQIKQHLNRPNFRYTGGVIRNYLNPNTDHYFDIETDYSPFTVCQIVKPNINPTSMNHWLDHQSIDYSVDKNHQVFFTPQQLQTLQATYKKYPDEKLYSNQEMLNLLNINNPTFQQLRFKYQIRYHQVLGDRRKYYTKDQLDFCLNQLKTFQPEY